MSVHPLRHHLDRRATELIEAASRRSDDELLSTPALAQWLGVSEPWLEIGRHRGWGPKFIKLSPRRVRYLRGDVRRWLEQRAHQSTGEYDSARLAGPGRAPAPKPKPKRQRVHLYDDDHRGNGAALAIDERSSEMFCFEFTEIEQAKKFAAAVIKQTGLKARAFSPAEARAAAQAGMTYAAAVGGCENEETTVFGEDVASYSPIALVEGIHEHRPTLNSLAKNAGGKLSWT